MKNAIEPRNIAPDTDMNVGSFTSEATTVKYMDNISYQVNFSGSASGTLDVEVSNDGENYAPLGLDISTAGGSPQFIDVNQTGAAKIRLTFESDTPGAQTITTRADVSSNLASKYFLIGDADNVHKYALWFKVGGTGTAPSVSGYTNEEVDITANNTADQVATALTAVITALTGFDATALGHVVTVVNTDIGSVELAHDGASNATGFTFAQSLGDGTMDVFVAAKGI